MDAVEFLKAKNRMCKTFDSCSGRDGGAICELYAKSNEKGLSCADYANDYPEEAVEIVERWAKEHPRKTRQSEFLKIFPRVSMTSNGTIDFCPESFDEEFACPEKGKFYRGECECLDCRRKYWLEEVEDDD